jgi:arylsulfatase
MPKLTNLRHDPFERMNWPGNGFAEGSIAYWNSFKHEMWRYQISAQVIEKYLPSFIEYPPMQAGASFNVGDLKEKIEQAMKAAHGNQQ